MQGHRGDTATEQVTSVLLAEFAHRGDALLHSEESGEGRVTILLAAIGAAATALPAIVRPEAPPWMLLWLMPVPGLLLLPGLFTLVRFANRNLQTDSCLERLWIIRSHVANEYEELRGRGYPRALVSDPRDKTRRRDWTAWQCLVGQKAGHVDLVEWANAAVFGTMVFVAPGAIVSVLEVAHDDLSRSPTAAGAAAAVAFGGVESGPVNRYCGWQGRSGGHVGRVWPARDGRGAGDGRATVATKPPNPTGDQISRRAGGSESPPRSLPRRPEWPPLARLRGLGDGRDSGLKGYSTPRGVPRTARPSSAPQSCDLHHSRPSASAVRW